MEEPSLVVSVTEAAGMLKLHPITVRRGIESGRIPGVKVGRRVLIPRAALEQWLLGKLEEQRKAERK